jgi:hypothetical protein
VYEDLDAGVLLLMNVHTSPRCRKDLIAGVLPLMYVQVQVAGRTWLQESTPLSQLVYEDLDAEFLLLDSAFVCARPGCRSPPPCR